jgi:hypothetical protein
MPDRYTKEDAAKAERALLRELIILQRRFDISDDDFAKILAMPEDAVLRMKLGETVIAHDSHSFKVGVAFVRMSRLLFGIVGGDVKSARSWLYSHNTALGDVPLYIMVKHHWAGIEYVIGYLESHSGMFR